MPTAPGQLVIISGPSGVGKSTIVPLVRQRFGGNLRMSVSATTRDPRPGEEDGVNYHFLSTEEFQSRLSAGDFIEAVEVFGRGHWYGTLIDEVTPSLKAGQWVILEVDVDGARKALQRFPEAATIFIAPTSLEVLEQRLRSRGTEAEQAIQRRLEVARRELEQSHTYAHIVVNENVEDAVEQMTSILETAGLKPSPVSSHQPPTTTQ